jgi:hypothetical protein
VQRAAGVESVAVRADPAHRVHRDRTSGHLRMLATVRVGPRDRQRDRLVEGGPSQLARDAADGVRGNAAAVADCVGGIPWIEIALGDEVEHRHRLAAVTQRDLADNDG